MNCIHCGEPARLLDRWCSRACMLEHRRERSSFARVRLSRFDRAISPFPNFNRELVQGWAALRAWSHRVVTSRPYIARAQ